jgi:hypothetical protein
VSEPFSSHSETPARTLLSLLGRLAGALKSPPQFPALTIVLIIRLFAVVDQVRVLLPLLFEHLNWAPRDRSALDPGHELFILGCAIASLVSRLTFLTRI